MIIQSFYLMIRELFFDDASFTETESRRSCSLKLESNTLYEFNFIKLADDELVLCENITIEH